MSPLKTRDHDNADLSTRQLPTRQELSPPAGAPDSAVSTAESREAAPSGVFVNHGIHQGTYPIAGLSVAQARTVLGPFMNVDPDSVAVIAGEIVEDESARVLTEDDTMLSFVKRASVKGER